MFSDNPKSLAGMVGKELNLDELRRKLNGEKSAEVREDETIIYGYEDRLTSELLCIAKKDEMASQEYNRRMKLLGLPESAVSKIRMNEERLFKDERLGVLRKWHWANRGFFYLGNETFPDILPDLEKATLSELLFVTLEGFIEYERNFEPQRKIGVLFTREYLTALERAAPQMFGVYRNEFDNRTAAFGWTEIQQQLYQRNEVIVLDSAKYLQKVEQPWTDRSMRTNERTNQDEVF